MKIWQLLRDILLTGSGIGILVWEVHLSQPSELMVGAALALITPGAYEHVKALLPGPITGASSGSPAPGSSSESGKESTGE